MKMISGFCLLAAGLSELAYPGHPGDTAVMIALAGVFLILSK